MRFCLSKHVWWRSLKMICARHYRADKGPKACRCQHAQYVQFILRYNNIFLIFFCVKLYETLLDHQGWCAWFHFCRPTFHIVKHSICYVSHGQEREAFMNFIHQQWERCLEIWSPNGRSHGPMAPGSIQTMSSCLRASSFLACQLFGKSQVFSSSMIYIYIIQYFIDIIEQGWDYLPNKEYVLQSGFRCWYKACNTVYIIMKLSTSYYFG